MQRSRLWAILGLFTLALVLSGGFLVSKLNRQSPARQVVVFLPSSDNPFWIEVRHGVEEAAKAAAGQIDVTVMASGDLDAASQVEQLKSVLDRRSVAAIVVGLANSRAPAPVISQYNRAGIPVVLIDTKLDAAAAEQAGAKWNAFIGSDNRAGGRAAAEAMIAALNSKRGRVLMIRGSFVHQSAIDRAEGFMQRAANALDVIQRDGEWSRQRANDLTAGVVSREPIDGIFAANDDMALGAIAALRNSSLSPQQRPVVIGFDATPAGIEAIRAGDMYASIRQDARGMGSAGVKAALELLTSKNENVPDQLIPVQVQRNGGQ